MGAPTPILGQVLGHYRLLEQIGAGGMGLVFRAQDEQLERDVAIKVLPPGILSDEAARKHFRREALTLAKLNHPNIGTVYEFANDQGLDYLVMEFVAGVPLDAKLASGPLSEREVLKLGFQLADGLACAHEKGIIHRDLKPANLRLTTDNRLKILDFGLAQLIRHDDFGMTASISTSTQVSGTLPYMAPEQLRGEVTDQRADIWAAGAVLYELATGRRPFPHSQGPVLIDHIFNKQPEAPRELNRNLSAELQMVILKCLDKDPEHRYQSARELRVDLERLGISASQPISAANQPLGIPASTKLEAPPAHAGLKLAVAVSVMVAILLGVFAFRHFRTNHRPEKTAAPVNKRRSVAVLNFKNLTARPEAAWLSTAIAEMLNTELAAGEKLRTVPGEEIARMKTELSLPDDDAFTPATLAQVRKNLGTDLVVMGSYVALPGGKLRLDLHLQDVVTGETLISVPETGDESNLFELVSRAGAQLRAKCGVGQTSTEDEAGVRASFPSTTEATRLYAEGLAKLRVSDAVAARDLLQEAITADPNHALAHSALAAAWTLLGYDEKARQSAKNAYDLSASLSREDRLLIEARYRQASKEWDNAAEIYHTLFGFFPDNLEYGLLLAKTQVAAGKSKAALATLDLLRNLPAPASEDARIDLTASDAWQAQGDFKQAQVLAAQAVQKAKNQGAQLILARALYDEASSFESLNDAKNAMSVVNEASRIYQSMGDRYGLASTQEVTGQVLFDHGDYPGALTKYKEELGIAREVGNRRAESSALNNMALVLDQQGDAEGAQKMWQQSLPIFREVGDKDGFATTQINIAGVFKDTGDLAGAKKLYDQGLSIFREINDQSGIALSLTALGTVIDAQGDSAGAKKIFDQVIADDLARGNANPSSDKLIDIGDALQHLGDLAAARKNYQDALTLSRAAGDKSMAAYALMGLGSLEMKAANFPHAHTDYAEALALRNELGEKNNVLETQVSAADLAIAEGHPADAEAPARQGRDEFHQTHKNDDVINSTAVLVHALLSAGKTDDALRELAKAAPTAAKNQNLAVGLDFALAKAHAEAASGKIAPAKATLREALAKATKSGYLGYQLEVRLALEEIEPSGNSAASRSRLQQLQRDAKENGFNLIAAKAEALQH